MNEQISSTQPIPPLPAGFERRRTVTLTDEQIDTIAQRAAEKAIDQITNQVYTEVGKTIVQKIVWLIGLAFIGLTLWLQSHGLIDVTKN